LLFKCLALVLRVKIDPAHALTFFCFLLFFTLCVFLRDTSETGLDTCSSDKLVALPRRESLRDELVLSRHWSLGDAAPMNGSRPKNDHLFGVFVGLGEELSEAGLGMELRTGIELRRRGEAGICSIVLSVLSRIAPAVLGLESDLGREMLCISASVPGSRGGEVADTMEEMLPETEWPGRAVAVLEASLETSDRGRGIYSRVSENPTRARGAGFGS
jgi:hypothetical protein